MLTRRDIIIKWSAYGLAALLLMLLHLLLLRGVRPFGVTMFLPPLLVAVVASVEDTRSSFLFALAVGILCDSSLPGTFPCVYTVSFSIAALLCSFLAQSVLQPGPLCSVTVSVVTFFILDGFNMLSLGLRRGASFSEMGMLCLRETAVSCLLLLVCHPVLLFLHRRFTL